MLVTSDVQNTNGRGGALLTCSRELRGRTSGTSIFPPENLFPLLFYFSCLIPPAHLYKSKVHPIVSLDWPLVDKADNDRSECDVYCLTSLTKLH